MIKYRFKQLLEKKGLTAKMASDVIGINASCISHLLNGNRKPSFEVIEKISNAFPDINMNWFIHGSGTMFVSSPNTEDTVKVNDEDELISFVDERQNKFDDDDHFTKVIKQAKAIREDKKNRRTLKRILLFFDDGSFEEYSS